MVKIIDIRNRTKRTNGTRKLSQVKNIVRHHSATATGNFDTFWKHWHHTKGWGTGGYHEIILRDGSVELCYDPHEITNGVANLNTSVYNICLVGNGSFTDAQEKAFDIRAKRAMKLFGLPVPSVKGHGEMPGAQTSCPGINMTVVRKRLSTGDVVEQVSKPKPAPSKPSVSKPSTNQTSSIVDYLNSKKIDSSADNRKKLAVEYGVKNYDLTAAKNTELLNKMRAGKPVRKPAAKPKPTPKPKENLAVDGFLGKATISALQRYFGTYVDGVISRPSPMVKALQKLLGVTQDGYWGADTTRALQRRFGTYVDGAISKPSPMIKELQRRLNKGKL